jgi:hypothetical protein
MRFSTAAQALIVLPSSLHAKAAASFARIRSNSARLRSEAGWAEFGEEDAVSLLS